MMTTSYDKLMEKWAPVLNEESAGKITDNHRKAVTAAILENQEREMNEQSQQLHEAVPTNNNANVANWNPVLIALVRRAMPNLMAYDICGVQPMSGPTGLIFAMKSQYKTHVLAQLQVMKHLQSTNQYLVSQVTQHQHNQTIHQVLVHSPQLTLQVPPQTLVVVWQQKTLKV